MEKQLILHLLNKDSKTIIKVEKTSESEENHFDSSILKSDNDNSGEFENMSSYIGSNGDDMNTDG